ncbi:MAG: FAD:protein FMN transferase [Rhodocyclaceae bacterium]
MRRLLTLLCLCLACALTACSQGHVEQQESYVFGTRVEVLTWDSDDARAQAALSAVLREFDRLHRTYHAWQPSELTALNEHIAQGEPTPITPEMASLLTTAQRFEAASGGLFDPAIGAIISAWGFQRDEFSPHIPAPDLLRSLVAARPRAEDVHIQDGVATSSNRNVRFDFGGLAKGYALDRAVTILREHGIHNALINIGGNIMALGSKGGTAWQVGIQSPRQAGPMATISLYDGEAIGTSGDYQRYFEVDGRRYSHLIDPRTGEPSEVSQAATVLITPRDAAGTLSDVASKPIFLSGDDWPAQARRMGIEHVLRVKPDGSLELTSAMRARVRWVGAEPTFTTRALP